MVIKSRKIFPIKVKIRNIGSIFSNSFSNVETGNILRVFVPPFNYGLKDVVAFTTLLAGFLIMINIHQ